MRKLFNEYLYVPEQGEGVVREKVFFARLFMSIAVIIVCMIAMGYNAYAFFTADVGSKSNVLQSATYEFVKPSATEDKLIVVVGGKGSVRAGDAVWKYILNEGTYDITFKKTPTSTATTGYARIDVIQGETTQQFYTEQIGGVYDAENKEITSRTIRITVNAEMTIQISECWGTYIGNTTTPIAENVIIEKQKMVEVKGTNIGSVAWVTPQSTNKVNAASSGTTTNTQVQTETSDDAAVQCAKSSQEQKDSQNTTEGTVENTTPTEQTTTE